jgi:hypothetical protein
MAIKACGAGVFVRLCGLAADVREEAIAEPLRAELASRGAVVPEIRVCRVGAIPRGATGKAPPVRRHAAARPDTGGAVA